MIGCLFNNIKLLCDIWFLDMKLCCGNCGDWDGDWFVWWNGINVLFGSLYLVV